MSDQFHDEFDVPESEAPPTQWEGQKPRPNWPTVIGVIGIIFASLALLGATCAVAFPVLIDVMMDMAEGETEMQEAIAQMAAETGWLPIYFTFVAVNIALSVYWLVASIKLVKRRRSAMTMLVIYSMIEIVHVVVHVGWIISNQINQAAAAAAEGVELDRAEEAAQAMKPFMTGCFAIPLGLAVPIFLLIWFTRPKIREEIATWDGGESGGYDQ